jgi:hypothetical protein
MLQKNRRTLPIKKKFNLILHGHHYIQESGIQHACYEREQWYIKLPTQLTLKGFIMRNLVGEIPQVSFHIIL